MRVQIKYYLCVKYLHPLIRDNEFYIHYRNNIPTIQIWNYPAPQPTIKELENVWLVADVYFRLEDIKKETIKRLIDSDWTHLTDHPLSTIQQKEWRAYREKLRVFPEVCDPHNPIWPKQPSFESESKSQEKRKKIQKEEV